MVPPIVGTPTGNSASSSFARSSQAGVDDIDFVEDAPLFPALFDFFERWRHQPVKINDVYVSFPLSVPTVTTEESSGELDGSGYGVVEQSEDKTVRALLELYAYGEYFARLLYKPMPFPHEILQITEEDGSQNEYRYHRLSTSNSGLVGYVLVPVKADCTRIKIVFRGTPFKEILTIKTGAWGIPLPALNEDAVKAVNRDILEHGGAGAQSFKENEAALLLQLNEILAKAGGDSETQYTVDIFGHSLGAGDAQLMGAAVLNCVAQNEGYVSQKSVPESDRSAFNKIRQLRIFPSNAVGIPKAEAEAAEAAVKFLYICRDRIPLTHVSVMSSIITFDPVSGTGDTHLFANTPSEYSDFLTTHLLKIKGSDPTKTLSMSATVTIGLAATLLSGGMAVSAALLHAIAGAYLAKKAHTHRPFDQSAAPTEVVFELASNTTKEGQAAIAQALHDAKFQSFNALHARAIQANWDIPALLGTGLLKQAADSVTAVASSAAAQMVAAVAVVTPISWLRGDTSMETPTTAASTTQTDEATGERVAIQATEDGGAALAQTDHVPEGAQAGLLTMAQAQVAEKEGQLKAAEAQVAMLKEALERNQAMLETGGNQLAALGAQLREVESTLSAQTQQFTHQAAELLEAGVQLVEKDTQLKAAEAQVAMLKEALERNQAMLETGGNQLAALGAQLREVESTLSAQTQQFTHQAAELLEAGVQLVEKDTQLGAAEAQVATLKQALEKNQAMLETNENQRVAQAARLKRIESEHAGLQAKHIEVSREKDALADRQRIFTEKEEQLAAAEAKVDRLSEVLQTAQALITDQNQLHAKQGELALAERDLQQFIQKTQVRSLKNMLMAGLFSGSLLVGGGVGVYLMLTLGVAAGITGAALIGATVATGVGAGLLAALVVGLAIWFFVKKQGQETKKVLAEKEQAIHSIAQEIGAITIQMQIADKLAPPSAALHARGISSAPWLWGNRASSIAHAETDFSLKKITGSI